MKYVLKTRQFSHWMKKTQLDDAALITALNEMARGLVDADLGSNLYKKRIALPGRGKSGSTRTIIATNRENRCFFLYGFEKNEKENISQAELTYLQGVANLFLHYSEAELEAAIA
ncbi:MAG: type II toxin-antitoxin system RelE/ParE family toxin, partial [Desulfovibrio sp.]|nr:type II toxin-antitoxin system RelE/ParE family toxin [Desulfovibrio sp.]